MVIIDEDACIGCGLCVKVCHNCCVTLVDGVAAIDYELCDRCSQCVAICPQKALSWDGVTPVAYDEAQLPSPAQLDELFKQRRSIRFFKQDRIARPLLERIVRCGIYAPTNNHDLRAVVVDDAAVIGELERTVVRFNLRMHKLFFKPRIVFALLRRITPAISQQVKAKMEGRVRDLFNPAAVVFIVGDSRIAFSEASAQAALDQMTFYAHAHGVGSCLWGAGVIILDRNKAARERLGLQKREHVLGALLLGYPAVRFVNKVEGRAMDTEWISGRDALVDA